MRGLGIEVVEPAEELGPMPLGVTGPRTLKAIGMGWRSFVTHAAVGAAGGITLGAAVAGRGKRLRGAGWGAAGGAATGIACYVIGALLNPVTAHYDVNVPEV